MERTYKQYGQHPIQRRSDHQLSRLQKKQLGNLQTARPSYPSQVVFRIRELMSSLRDGKPCMRMRVRQVPPRCGEEASEWPSSERLERHSDDEFVLVGMSGGSLSLGGR